MKYCQILGLTRLPLISAASSIIVALLLVSAAASNSPFEKVEYGCVHIEVRGGSLGTGFFVHTNGYLLTNYHVIQGGRQVRIRTRDGSIHHVSHVLNFSPRHDLALLKVDYIPSVILEIATPEETRVGMDIYVIGSPHGLSWARSQGKIEGYIYDGFEKIQHSARTDSGNSGSPIFDTNGRVHGIHTWSVARKVRAAEGGYRYDWINPQARGVSNRVIAQFLAQPHRPIHFATLATSYDAAEQANLILWACQQMDQTMRQLHRSIRDMRTHTETTTDPTRRGLSGQPIITSQRTYFANTQDFVRESSNFSMVLRFLHANLKGQSNDPSIQYTLNHWNQSQQRLQTAISTIRSAHGSDPATVSRAYRTARHEFTQANDSFYQALSSAVNTFNRHSFAYCGDPLYDPDTINRMLSFYSARGLQL